MHFLNPVVERTDGRTEKYDRIRENVIEVGKTA